MSFAWLGRDALEVERDSLFLCFLLCSGVCLDALDKVETAI